MLNLPLMIGASVAAPILTNFVSGEKLEKIITARKLVLGTMTTFFVLTLAQIITEQVPPAAVRRVSIPATQATTARPIKLSSGVGVGGWVSEAQNEFYSGTPPYPSGHIYID